MSLKSFKIVIGTLFLLVSASVVFAADDKTNEATEVMMQ